MPDPVSASTTVRRSRGRRAWWISLFCCAAATVGLTADLLSTQARVREETLSRAKGLAAQAAGAIDKSFHEAKDIAETIAQDLAKGTLPYSEIEKRMLEECGKRADLDGIAITFQPFAY